MLSPFLFSLPLVDSVLASFSLCLLSMSACYCNTPDGKYILQEYDNSNDKMVSMKSLYNHLESSGIKTDYVIPNKEDRYVSVSEDGYTYILKKWFESQECNINEEKHIVMGAANIGRFHTL